MKWFIEDVETVIGSSSRSKVALAISLTGSLLMAVILASFYAPMVGGFTIPLAILVVAATVVSLIRATAVGVRNREKEGVEYVNPDLWMAQPSTWVSMIRESGLARMSAIVVTVAVCLGFPFGVYCLMQMSVLGDAWPLAALMAGLSFSLPLLTLLLSAAAAKGVLDYPSGE